MTWLPITANFTDCVQISDHSYHRTIKNHKKKTNERRSRTSITRSGSLTLWYRVRLRLLQFFVNLLTSFCVRFFRACFICTCDMTWLLVLGGLIKVQGWDWGSIHSFSTDYDIVGNRQIGMQNTAKCCTVNRYKIMQNDVNCAWKKLQNASKYCKML